MLGTTLAEPSSGAPGKDRAPDMLLVSPEDLQTLHREGHEANEPSKIVLRAALVLQQVSNPPS